MNWTNFWAMLGSFVADWPVLVLIFAIIVGALVLRWLLLVILRRAIDRVVSGVKKNHNVEETQELASAPLSAARIVQRTRTLGTVINSVLTVVVLTAALIAILQVIGVPVLGILGAAGVVAAGLAFGAQNVGVRITSIRDVNGTLWHVRNGEILRVGNKTQGWARVILDIPVPYHSDLDEVKDAVLATAKEMADDPQWRRKVIEVPEIWGIESITAEALVMRLVMKTRSADQWDIARELRARVKRSLDGLGVNVPSLNRMIVDDRSTGGITSSNSEVGADDASTPSVDE